MARFLYTSGAVWSAPFVVAAGLAAGLIAGGEWHPRTTERPRAAQKRYELVKTKHDTVENSIGNIR